MDFPFDIFIEEAHMAHKSEAYIEKYTHYAQRLIEQGLPVIFDIGHLAHYMNISKERLLEIVHKKEYYYY